MFEENKFCRHGSNCHFKHAKKTDSRKDNVDETVRALKAEGVEKDALIENLKKEKTVLEEKCKSMEDLKSKLDRSEEALTKVKKEATIKY